MNLYGEAVQRGGGPVHIGGGGPPWPPCAGTAAEVDGGERLLKCSCGGRGGGGGGPTVHRVRRGPGRAGLQLHAGAAGSGRRYTITLTR